jgi:hypothetical protein
MSLADPTVVTVNTVAKSMPRISTGSLSSSYALADRTYQLNVSHQITKDGRFRHTVEMVVKKVAADPVSSVNDSVQTTYRFLIDREAFGFSATEIGYDVAGLTAWLNSNIAKIFGTES